MKSWRILLMLQSKSIIFRPEKDDVKHVFLLCYQNVLMTKYLCSRKNYAKETKTKASSDFFKRRAIYNKFLTILQDNHS